MDGQASSADISLSNSPEKPTKCFEDYLGVSPNQNENLTEMEQKKFKPLVRANTIKHEDSDMDQS